MRGTLSGIAAALPVFGWQRSGHIVNVISTEVSPGFAATEFAASINDSAVRKAVKERGAGLAMPPEAVARAIAFAIEQPDDVDVGSIVVRPTAQD